MRGEKREELNLENLNKLWESRVKPYLAETESGCWEWNKANSRGYGQIRISVAGKPMVLQTHRIAAMVKENRILKPSEFVCHDCDNPKCCNPAHLFVGSQSDNMRDASMKGRTRGTFQKGQQTAYVAYGEDVAISKLTEEDVRKMRQMYADGVAGHKTLAKMFGVSSRTAYCVLKRITWKHIL